jgi:hypothetical protein
MAETISMKLGIYIMVPEPILTAYFINPSDQSVSVYVSPVVARHRIGKKITPATNILATIEELLDASFPMRSVSSMC